MFGQCQELARQLGLAVNIERIGRAVFGDGAVVAAVEYIVGRQMDKAGTGGFGGTRQIQSAAGVYRKGFGGVAFGFVYLGVGGGVDDGIGLEGFHHIEHIARIGDVQRFGVGGNQLPVFRQPVFKTLADLAFGSGE